LLTMDESDEDELAVFGAELPSGQDNLAWKAVEAVRQETGAAVPVSMRLTKRIPEAAGLGGGSADAALAAVSYAELIGETLDLDPVVGRVGADVTFCLHGGLRWMSGHGERLSDSLDSADDYWVVVAVPPFSLSTPAVYSTWDRLGEPEGFAVSGRDVPPSLRVHAPLINDLFPAARALEPELDDWRSELTQMWDREVLMSGSGPSLFAFFADEEEATEALAAAPRTVRGVFAAPPIASGAQLDER